MFQNISPSREVDSQSTGHASSDEGLYSTDQGVDQRNNPDDLPVFALNDHGVAASCKMDRGIKYEGPEEGKAPDVAGMIEIVRLNAIDWEGPVKRWKAWCHIIEAGELLASFPRMARWTGEHTGRDLRARDSGKSCSIINPMSRNSCDCARVRPHC